MLFYFRKSSERLDKLQAENHELNGNNARLKSQVRLQGCRNINLICLLSIRNTAFAGRPDFG